MSQKGRDLELILERAYRGYAYDVMALEIEIEEQLVNPNSQPQSGKQNGMRLDVISKLISLYMLGVEILESRSDPRYKYFNTKIQNLMKKKHVIEELHAASTNKRSSENNIVLKAAELKEISGRKEEHQVQMILGKGSMKTNEIRKLVNEAEDKLKAINSKIVEGAKSQEKKIEERLRLRKMKSDAGNELGSAINAFIGLTSQKKQLDISPRLPMFIRRYYNSQVVPHPKKACLVQTSTYRLTCVSSLTAKTIYLKLGTFFPKPISLIKGYLLTDRLVIIPETDQNDLLFPLLRRQIIKEYLMTEPYNYHTHSLKN